MKFPILIWRQMKIKFQLLRKMSVGIARPRNDSVPEKFPGHAPGEVSRSIFASHPVISAARRQFEVPSIPDLTVPS
jgi:hypothetical protein